MSVFFDTTQTMPPRISLDSPLPIPLNSSSTRARLLFYSMPNNLRPILADHPLVCPHGKTRVFDIDMATERFSDIFARVDVSTDSVHIRGKLTAPRPLVSCLCTSCLPTTGFFQPMYHLAHQLQQRATGGYESHHDILGRVTERSPENAGPVDLGDRARCGGRPDGG
jgi:hypothetical protein